MTATVIPIGERLLKRFCSSVEDRRNLSAPWVRGGYRYASDAFVIVRLPATGEPDSDVLGPGAVDTFRFAPVGEMKPWPAAGYTFDEKWETCDACEEEYRTFAPSHVAQRIGNRLIATRLHYSISLLPNVEYSTDPKGKLNAPLYFRFDGGDGLVMPMNPELIHDLPKSVCDSPAPRDEEAPR